MKAYVATGAEAPRVREEDVSSPEVEPGSVLVDVEAISLNRGELSALGTAGARPGWDIAGTVAQTSADGGGPAVGTRVAAVVREGGWATQVAVPVGQVGAIPDGVSLAQASTLGIAGITALRILRAAGPVEGKSVLITGASGAVGRFAVQLAVGEGAAVTATVSKETQVEAVRTLGAGEVIVGEELPGGYDIVIDGVGGPALEAGIRGAGPGARILTYGIAGGSPASIRFADFRNGPGSTLSGFFVWQTDLSTFGRDLAELADLVAAGDLSAHIAQTYAWTDFDDALTALIERRASGKLVVQVA